MEPELLQPPSLGSFVWFSTIVCQGGGGEGSLVASVTLDTVADESRRKMADGLARSPSRLRSRDGKICCCGDALGTIFLIACICALLPTLRFTILFVFFLHPGAFIFVSIRLFSSRRLLSASTCSFYLWYLYLDPISQFLCFLFDLYFFSWLLFLWWRVIVLSCPVR